LAATHIRPKREQIAALRERNLPGPVLMLNLLRFAPDGGAEAYRRYGGAAAPVLEKSGARVRYLGQVMGTVIAGETWDEVILVEYPTVQAFLDMSMAPDCPAELRAGALADSRLYCTQPAG
jgi:uncharacterized protein (DUF1330 family)